MLSSAEQAIADFLEDRLVARVVVARVVRDRSRLRGLLGFALFRSPSRTDLDVNEARRAVYEELRALGWSYPRIGRAVGRDHSTVHQALKGRRG